eukprot:204460-Hanusia_phi.AAC.4
MFLPSRHRVVPTLTKSLIPSLPHPSLPSLHLPHPLSSPYSDSQAVVDVFPAENLTAELSHLTHYEPGEGKE